MPARLKPLFAGVERVLDSHRGLDYGALEVARAFGKRLDVAPVTATVTRLVCDLNRSLHHRDLFSKFTRTLSAEKRAAILAQHYWPYHLAVERSVAHTIAGGRSVLHVSAHSFTPALHGEVRDCDIGFLYDPSRATECKFVDAWYAALRDAAPALTLRRNYPYRGVADSLVTHLRGQHGARSYVGLEFEVNQKHVGSPGWRALVAILARSLATAAEHHTGLPL